jgi:hypothetical protein
MLKPVDMVKSSGIIVYEVVNRESSIVRKNLECGDVIRSSGWLGNIPF